MSEATVGVLGASGTVHALPICMKLACGTLVRVVASCPVFSISNPQEKMAKEPNVTALSTPMATVEAGFNRQR